MTDLKQLRARYQQDPAAGMFTYRTHIVTPELDDPMHAETVSIGHGTARYRATVNERIGGSGGEPTPGDIMLGALATCQAMAFKMVAAGLKIELTSLDVEAECDVDHRGVLLVPGVRPGATAIRMKVTFGVRPGTPPEVLAKLQFGALASCAITDNLRNPTPLAVEYACLAAPSDATSGA